MFGKEGSVLDTWKPLMIFKGYLEYEDLGESWTIFGKGFLRKAQMSVHLPFF
jgi:hypothetical protein